MLEPSYVEPWKNTVLNAPLKKTQGLLSLCCCIALIYYLLKTKY